MNSFRILLNLGLLSGFFLIQSWLSASAGQLAVGANSKVTDGVRVRLYSSSDLNYKSRVEIISMRRRILEESPLYKGTYSPNDYVFAQIEDNKPWWGMHGMYVYRAGKKSILGPSKESRYLLNPYLLVGAEPTCIGLISPTKVNEKILSTPGFPFVWTPENLVWYPREFRAQVTYDVSAYQRQITRNKKYMSRDCLVNKFSLIAYNAKDLGYNYIYPDVENSMNVENQYKDRRPIELKQMIHCGGSCRYPGGCNNMSPIMAELDFLKFRSLPAKLTMRLWKDKPRSVLDKADFIYVINLK